MALWERRTVNPFSILHSRGETIDLSNLLQDFMVTNPGVVMRDYLQYAYRRIEHARLFGAKGEIAEQLAKKMELGFGPDAGKLARVTYHTANRSMRSWVINQMAGMSRGVNMMTGRVAAFETLKLGLAQSVNLGQALVNGSVYLTKASGNPFYALYTAAKEARRTMSSGARREILDRTGAAVETTMLQLIGETSQQVHSIAGREFTGIFRPLEYLNNPTKFLRATGFTAVEEWNRA